jgi:sedoheptulose-bisphosphatase
MQFADGLQPLLLPVCITEIAEGKLFAPGNLRATFDNPAYERLISHYLGEKYTLR